MTLARTSMQNGLSENANDQDDHPYSYARVLRIFDAEFQYIDPLSPSPPAQPHRVQFLWVRWFEIDPFYHAGWEAKRQHRVRFVQADSPTGAFGFLDPADVIRGVHLLPAFAYGTTDAYLGMSAARHEQHTKLTGHKDYTYFYVNM